MPDCQDRIPVGTKVDHLFSGPCTIIEYTTTLIGWTSVKIKDAGGEIHEVNPIYLKIIEREEVVNENT